MSICPFHSSIMHLYCLAVLYLLNCIQENFFIYLFCDFLFTNLAYCFGFSWALCTRFDVLYLARCVIIVMALWPCGYWNVDTCWSDWCHWHSSKPSLFQFLHDKRKKTTTKGKNGTDHEARAYLLSKCVQCYDMDQGNVVCFWVTVLSQWKNMLNQFLIQ